MMGLDDLIPATRSVSAGGKTVVVQVLRVRQYAAFTKAIEKPYPLILAGDYLAAVSECPDEVIAAVCAATDLDRAFVAELDGHAFLQLAAAVMELNLDFFARAVLPTARKTAASITAAMTGFSRFLPDSSEPDTAMPPSSSSPLRN